MLTIDNTVFVLVDVQGKLASVMHEKEALFDNLTRIVRAMNVLEIPIIWMEQIPEKMGETISQLKELLPDQKPIAKTNFSCCGSEEFMDQLKQSGRKQVLIAGIETHVCVYQTAVDLMRSGYAVEVIADAVSSRNPVNKDIGLHKIKACGARSVGSGQGHITTVETAIFELMQTSEHTAFRDILKIVR